MNTVAKDALVVGAATTLACVLLTVVGVVASRGCAAHEEATSIGAAERAARSYARAMLGSEPQMLRCDYPSVYSGEFYCDVVVRDELTPLMCQRDRCALRTGGRR